MKNINWFIAAILFSSSSIAADFPHRADVEARSKAVGVGLTKASLLHREVGPGAEVAASQLLTHWANGSGPITTAGTYSKMIQGNNKLLFVGNKGWTLRVYADGTGVEYRNFPYRKAHLAAVPIDKQPTLSGLDAIGRDFISKNLGGLVSLGQNDAIVGHSVRYERLGSQAVDGSPATTSTVGAIVTYSRTLNGVDIVGAGSKIVVMFTADGTPWGFSYDWPTYTTTTTQQQVLPLTGIRKRHASLISNPANLASDTEQHFECGYYDVGVRYSKRDSNALIQMACVSQRVVAMVGDTQRYQVNQDNGLFRMGKVDVIPAGVDISSDSSWPEALQISGKGVGTNSSDPGANASN